jgi:Zn-dependent protease
MLGFLILMINGGPSAFVEAAIFFAVLMGSVFLHELGHAWGCRIQGVPVRRVMLYGGGGFCEPARSTSSYEDELIVAMGPIVNLVLWAVSSLAIQNLNLSLPVHVVLYQVAWLNVFLAIFNLLPVMPLDGGRLFQLLLMRFMPAPTATRIAGGVGVVVCILWIPILIVGFFFLGFVLFFFPSFRLHLQMARQ